MKNKKILMAVFVFLVVLILFVGFVGLNYFQAQKLSIKVANQKVLDVITVDSVNIPQNGFVYIFQKRDAVRGDLYIGSSDYLKKGKYKDLKIKIRKLAKEKISSGNPVLVASLIGDTTGDRVLSVVDDAPIKSIFGFEFQKEFLKL